MTVAAILDVSDYQPNPKPLLEKTSTAHCICYCPVTILVLSDYTSHLGYIPSLLGSAVNQILPPES